MPSDRFVGGATLHKELQGFVSFVAYQKTCLRNGTAMSQLAQQEALANEYFGNPDDDDSVGLCEQLIEGVGLFAHLFDREERIQTDAQGKNANSRNPNQASTLVLKAHLHSMSNTKVVVSDSPRDINWTLLHSSTLSAGSNVIKAKALILRAQEHIKHCKKALSVIANPRSPYSPYIKTGNLPSGMTMSDYYMYVRKKMFILLGCADAKMKKVTVKKGKGPALPALTAGSVNAIADILQMKASGTTDTSDDLLPVAPEEDGASATSGSFRSCNPNSTASKDAGQSELDSSRSAEPPLEVQVDDGVVGDSMPQDWIFPGFISFALLGPIVPPSLLPYRSEIMMPSLPTIEPGNTAHGRAALRKEKALKSKVGVAAIPPPKSKAVTLQQKLMIAGIAQSQMHMEKREQNREQDRMIAFYQKKVAAQRMLIEQIKYTISVTPAEAPNRTELLEQLNVLNSAFTNAVTECLNAEEEMLKKTAAAKDDEKLVAAKSFIDLTIATVLGVTEDEEDDCEIIAVIHQKKKDSVVNASLGSSVLSNKKMKANPSGSTPMSSNKKRKLHRPVGGRTMTSPIGRLKDNVSPLSCQDDDSE